MNCNPNYEDIAQLADEALSIDPLMRGRAPNFAELYVLNAYMGFPPTCMELIANEDGSIAKRIFVMHPPKHEAGDATIDLVFKDGRFKETVINMDAQGWGEYKIDTDGKIFYCKDGLETKAGLARKTILRKRLNMLI